MSLSGLAMTHDIAILIPTFNEARHICDVLHIARTAHPRALILIADGGSHDATVPILLRHMQRDPKLMMIHNPKQYQAHGLNLLSQWADQLGASIALRLDAHAGYKLSDLRAAAVILRHASAALLTVSRTTTAPYNSTAWQRHCATWSQLPIAQIAAPFRTSTSDRTARINTHGHHLGWHLRPFLSVGGYRASLPAAEDLALDDDLKNAGLHIQFRPELSVQVYPRQTAKQTSAQLFRNGHARVEAFGLKAWRAPRLWLAFVGFSVASIVAYVAPSPALLLAAIACICAPALRVGCLSALSFLSGACSATIVNLHACKGPLS